MGKCTSCADDSHKFEDNVIKNLQRKNELLANSLLELTTYLTQTNKRGNTSAPLQKLIPELQRIVGGVAVEEGEFPECCLIGNRNANGTISWFCTGVLVDSKTVLSAAHCINAEKSSFVVALNLESIFKDIANNDTEIIDVRRVVVHPNYSTHRLNANDMAVLILQEEAKTKPVKVATSKQLKDAKQVKLVGFGNNDMASTKGFGVKRKVDVDIVSLRRTEEDNLNQDEAQHEFDSDLEFVAGGNGFDSCNGDSGGPAYIEIKGKRYVAGLTSRAAANYDNICGDGGVYTRVDVQADFIKEAKSTPKNFV